MATHLKALCEHSMSFHMKGLDPKTIIVTAYPIPGNPNNELPEGYYFSHEFFIFWSFGPLMKVSVPARVIASAGLWWGGLSDTPDLIQKVC